MKNFNLLNMNWGLTQFQPPIKNINESEYANYESTINVLDEKTIDIFQKIYYMKINYLNITNFINIIIIIIKCFFIYIFILFFFYYYFFLFFYFFYLIS